MRLPALKKLDGMEVINVVSQSFGVVAVRETDAGHVEYISILVLAQSRLPAVEKGQYGTIEDRPVRGSPADHGVLAASAGHR